MSIQVKYYGIMADISTLQQEEISGCTDTFRLRELLMQKYPGFKNQTFLISANRKIVHSPVELKAGDEIAVLPPFSGG